MNHVRSTIAAGSRAPHGARGLKLVDNPASSIKECRAPHGARGLKLFKEVQTFTGLSSRPAWGAWIETVMLSPPYCKIRVAPRMGRVD